MVLVILRELRASSSIRRLTSPMSSLTSRPPLSSSPAPDRRSSDQGAVTPLNSSRSLRISSCLAFSSGVGSGRSGGCVVKSPTSRSSRPSPFQSVAQTFERMPRLGVLRGVGAVATSRRAARAFRPPRARGPSRCRRYGRAGRCRRRPRRAGRDRRRRPSRRRTGRHRPRPARACRPPGERSLPKA